MNPVRYYLILCPVGMDTENSYKKFVAMLRIAKGVRLLSRLMLLLGLDHLGSFSFIIIFLLYYIKI